LEDQAFLLQQVEDLEKSSPRHPRLGQWKARLDRLNQVLSEVTEAEKRAASNMPLERPRGGLVPQDPQFEIQQPQIPAKTLPRRKSSPPGTREPKRDSEPIRGLDATILTRADTILQELERRKVPMTLRALAQRLGVSTHALYTSAPICDRLAQHNKRCPVSMQEIVEAQLKELQTSKKTATPEEFAQLCGCGCTKLNRHYKGWKQKLGDHNRSVREERLRDQAEQHLRDLISAQKCEPLRDFTKHIGTGPGSFTRCCPDIAGRVLQHNRELELRNSINHVPKKDRIAHIYKRWNEARESELDFTLTELAKYCSVDPDTIRTLCPELLPQLRKRSELEKRKIDAALALAFAEIENSGEVKTVKAFATAAGISPDTLSESYHHWVARLDQHNSITREAKLQSAWINMESSGAVWSREKFAEEAGIRTETLQKSYSDWCNRLKTEVAKHEHEVAQCLDQILEEARQSQAFLTLSEVAKEAGIGHKALKGHFSSTYNRIVEHNETTFRPIVEGVWREVIASGECPTLAEFTQRCGLQHCGILQRYFPEIVEKLRIFRNQESRK
jgi:hypothetical protein